MEYTIGDIIEKAKVINIKDFGAFVEISPSHLTSSMRHPN